MIEESEAALDFEENLALVNAAQMRCIEVWTPSPLLLTSFSNLYLTNRMQNYEVTQVSPAYHLSMWIKQD